MNLTTKVLVGLASAAIVSSSAVMPISSASALTSPSTTTEVCGDPEVSYSYENIPAAPSTDFQKKFEAGDASFSVSADLDTQKTTLTVANDLVGIGYWVITGDDGVEHEVPSITDTSTLELPLTAGSQTFTATPYDSDHQAFLPVRSVSVTVGNVPAPSPVSETCTGDVQVAPGGVFVVWKNQNGDETVPGTHYEIRFTNDSGYDHTVPTQAAGVRVTDLPAGDYRYSIATINADGVRLEDQQVRVLRVTDLPSAPTSFKAEASGSDMVVSWDTSDAKGKPLTSWQVFADLDHDGEFWSEGEQVGVLASDYEGFSSAQLVFPHLRSGDYDFEIYSVAASPDDPDVSYASPTALARGTVVEGVNPDEPPVDTPDTPDEPPVDTPVDETPVDNPDTPVEEVPVDEVPVENTPEAPAPNTPVVTPPATPDSSAVPQVGKPVANPDGSKTYVGADGTPTKVYGAIGDFYAAAQGDTGLLGAPRGEEFGIKDGGRVQRFEGGLVYWTAKTGAQEVHGAIRDRFATAKWENSELGYPTTSETSTPDKNGRFNHFQGGSIYWTPQTGAQVVKGAIREAWSQAGWEKSTLGYPTGEEFAIKGGRHTYRLQNGLVVSTPTTEGRVQRFQSGLAYWSPETGAHLVSGAFQGTFASQGWENGTLGYPTSEEIPTATGVVQHYQGGTLAWDKNTGKVTRS